MKHLTSGSTHSRIRLHEAMRSASRASRTNEEGIGLAHVDGIDVAHVRGHGGGFRFFDVWDNNITESVLSLLRAGEL